MSERIEMTMTGLIYPIVVLTRQALSDHLDELLAMDRDTVGERWDESHFRFELPDKWDCSRLAVDTQGRAIGFAIASRKGECLHIHRLVVKKSHRGHGLGTLLLRELASLALHHGISTLSLKVSKQNTGATEFYRRLGFTEFDTGTGNLAMSVIAKTLSEAK